MLERVGQARLEGDGHQVVDVLVQEGYRPEVIRAQAGIPLRINFRRTDDDPCTERVIFSAPHLVRRLAGNTTTVVELPAQAPSEIRLTCGMGRYRARIELVEKQEPGIGAFVHRHIERLFAARRTGA